jgi:hypothetical protein
MKQDYFIGAVQMPKGDFQMVAPPFDVEALCQPSSIRRSWHKRLCNSLFYVVFLRELL